MVVRAVCDDPRALARHPAAGLRWELLPFAETRLRGELRLRVVLQLGPKRLGAPRGLEHGGLRVVFMASSPQEAQPELDFEREEEALLGGLAPLIERRRARLRIVEEGAVDVLLPAVSRGIGLAGLATRSKAGEASAKAPSRPLELPARA